LLGGRMPMYADKARAALDTLARRIGTDAVTAAAGVVEIINVNMIGAVRVISVEQGEDPRDFALVAFGGAGPLHAAEVARNMGMRRIVVPPRPGILSAIGLMYADVRGDFSLTQLLRAEPGNLKAINRGCHALKKRGSAWLKNEGEARASFEWYADLRYAGQNFELMLELRTEKLDEAALAKLVARFHHRHKDYYGYDMPRQPVEIVNLRLSVIAGRRRPPMESTRHKRGALTPALLETRKVWFPETGFIATPVYDRDRLPAQSRLVGPAIVEQMDATTVIPPKARVKNDAFGCLHIELEQLARKGKTAWVAA